MLTTLALRFLARATGACAHDTVERCAAALGVIAYELGIRRGVVRRNLDLVFQGAFSLAPRRRRQVMRQCYASMGANFIGLFHLGQRPANALTHVEVAAPRHLQRVVDQYQSIIFQTAHLGCWDVGAAFLAHIKGPVQVYAKPQHNEAADKQINIMRERLGFSVLLAADGDRRGAVKAARGLREGISLGLLADQGPPPADGKGAWFLGQEVSCHAGPSFFSRQSDLPVVSGVMARVGAGRYRFFHGVPCLPGRRNADDYHQFLMDRLSAMIVSLPGQYFWHHKRFKYVLHAEARDQPGYDWSSARLLAKD